MTDIEELNVYDPELSHKKQSKPDIFVPLNEDGDKKKTKKIVVKGDQDDNENNNESKKVPKVTKKKN